TFTCKIKYFATLNDLAIQSQYQTNRAQIFVQGIDLDASGATGPTAVQDVDGVQINDSTPGLACEQFLSSSTGLHADRRTTRSVARITGNPPLTNLWIDALIPNGTTLVPDSPSPPPTAIIPNPRLNNISYSGRTLIRWRALPGLTIAGGGLSSLGVTYAVTLN